jgi:hypothetical protein
VTDRRGVLESIAYGEDPEIRVGDRLRALELLAQLDELALEELLFRDTARMSPEETDVALDSGLAVILGEILSGRGEEIVEDYPRTLDVVESALDRRAREIAFELRAAEERAYVPAREPEPIAPALATGVEIEKTDARAEIGDPAGPWALLSDHWRTD